MKAGAVPFRSLCMGLLLALGGCASLARDAIYAPRAEPVQIAEWTEQPPAEIQVTTRDGVALHGFFWAGRPGDRDLILFFHGRHSHQGIGARYAQHLRGNGDAVMVASYRGFGGNSGAPSRAGLLNDAAAFIAEARARVGQDARIWLVGHSLGAAVALQAACRDNKVAGVITINAFHTLKQVAPPALRGAIGKENWDNGAAARCVSSPLLIFNGMEDERVPPESGRALLAAASGKAVAISIEGGTHQPAMQSLGPWSARAIEALAQDKPLPALLPGWSIIGERQP